MSDSHQTLRLVPYFEAVRTKLEEATGLNLETVVRMVRAEGMRVNHAVTPFAIGEGVLYCIDRSVDEGAASMFRRQWDRHELHPRPAAVADVLLRLAGYEKYGAIPSLPGVWVRDAELRARLELLFYQLMRFFVSEEGA